MVLKKIFTPQHEVDMQNTIQLNPILDKIGRFGKFHAIQLLLMFVARAIGGRLGLYSYAYTAYLPKYRCLVPQCEDIATATYYNTSVTYNDNWRDDQLTFSRFTEEAILSLDVSEHECQRINVKQEVQSCQEFMALLATNSSSKTIETCGVDELVFDKKIVESSYATKFHFVCDNFKLRGIFNSLIMVGMILGSLTIPALSDKIGRKKAAILSILLTWAAGLINAFTNSVVLFAIGRILNGIGAVSMVVVLAVLMYENTTPEYTSLIENGMNPLWNINYMFLPLTAYFFRDYFSLEIALSAPMVLGLIPVFFMGESARWLISKGRLEEAKETIRHIAKVNGKVRPEEVEIVLEPRKEEGPKPHLKELFKHKVLILRSLNSSFQWWVVTGTFYGLTFGAVKVAGSPYLNGVIVSCFGLPDFLISCYLVDRLGRKWSLALSQGLSGICCLALGFLVDYGGIPQLQVMFVAIGKSLATMAFALVYIMASEMYPTAFRGTMSGLFSMMGRFGGVYALCLDGLRRYWEPLPFILLGGQAVVAGFLAHTFPETTGCKLPETIDDALTSVGKDPKFRPWCDWDNKQDEHEMKQNKNVKGESSI